MLASMPGWAVNPTARGADPKVGNWGLGEGGQARRHAKPRHPEPDHPDKRREVRVPTHDDVGTAVNGGLEELVVIGVAARTNLLHDLHDFN